MTFPSLQQPENTTAGRTLRVSMVQTAFTPATSGHDPRDENLAHALEGIRSAADDGAELIVIGELFLQGPGGSQWASYYSTRLDGSDDHVRELERAAAELGVHIAMGCTSFGSPYDVHNSALVVTPDRGLVGTYTRLTLPASRTPGASRTSSPTTRRGEP